MDASLQGLAAQCVPGISAHVRVAERTRVWEGVGRRFREGKPAVFERVGSSGVLWTPGPGSRTPGNLNIFDRRTTREVPEPDPGGVLRLIM
jgi:hypothetical protein